GLVSCPEPESRCEAVDEDAVLMAVKMESTLWRLGDREQTGSAAAGSPGSRRAWQGHPPKACVRRGQDFEGCLIPSLPRNLSKAAEFSQISGNERCLTLSKRKPGMTWAAWQGSASPLGVISISLRPQPPMQALGYLA